TTDLPGLIVAHADVADLALANEILERSKLFLQGCVRVELMQQVHVDSIGAESPQRALRLAHDVVPGSTLVVRTLADRTGDFGGDDHVVAVPSECTPENFF